MSRQGEQLADAMGLRSFYDAAPSWRGWIENGAKLLQREQQRTSTELQNVEMLQAKSLGYYAQLAAINEELGELEEIIRRGAILRRDAADFGAAIDKILGDQMREIRHAEDA